MKNTSKNQSCDYLDGRGAQFHPENTYQKSHYEQMHNEGIDEMDSPPPSTEYILRRSNSIVNEVASPDVGMTYSVNPYQGCEHGCIYCYARNTHEYWGYDAGLDFESKVVIKQNAPQLLQQQFENPNWKVAPISLSGNTDCYQPVERKMEITRELLRVCWEYRHPVGIITKNSLILRDLDILSKLAKHDLVHVMISITTLKASLRRKMEPRTTTAARRLETINKLTNAGVPTGVMNAPIIPGLNSEEIPKVIRKSAEQGARTAGYTIVRLNAKVDSLFKDWLYKNFSEAKASKVIHHIESCHGGQVNDSRWGKRIKGEGKIADAVRQLHSLGVKKYMPESDFNFNFQIFRRKSGHQKRLF